MKRWEIWARRRIISAGVKAGPVLIMRCWSYRKAAQQVEQLSNLGLYSIQFYIKKRGSEDV